MRGFLRRPFFGLCCSIVVAGVSQATRAADLGPTPPLVLPAETPPGWSLRFIPYGWLTSLKGTQTVRGRSAKVDAGFVDIIEKSDTLVGLMGTFEARNGPLALYSDLVWNKVGVEGGNIRSRSLTPNVTTNIGTSLEFQIQMAIVEVGAAYEVVRAGPLAFDLLGGARYWNQDADVSFDLVRTIEIGDLELVGARAFARSGAVDWVDPVIGARVRYAVAPGHELFLRGDVGGFGVGSNFSWQAIGGYGIGFGAWNGIAFSGVLGYRALYVDYAQGSGRTRYEFDMLQHGPVFGLSMRF